VRSFLDFMVVFLVTRNASDICEIRFTYLLTYLLIAVTHTGPTVQICVFYDAVSRPILPASFKWSINIKSRLLIAAKIVNIE